MSSAFETSSNKRRGASRSSAASTSRCRTAWAGSAGSATGMTQSTTRLASTTGTLSSLRARFAVADHQVGGTPAAAVVRRSHTLRPVGQGYCVSRRSVAHRHGVDLADPAAGGCHGAPSASPRARPRPNADRLRMASQKARRVAHADRTLDEIASGSDTQLSAGNISTRVVVHDQPATRSHRWLPVQQRRPPARYAISRARCASGRRSAPARIPRPRRGARLGDPARQRRGHPLPALLLGGRREALTQ